MEALYSNMIKEDAIIGALKAVTSLTEGLNGTLTLLGGIEHTLPLIMNLMMATFSPKLAFGFSKGIDKVANGLKLLTTAKDYRTFKPREQQIDNQIKDYDNHLEVLNNLKTKLCKY